MTLKEMSKTVERFNLRQAITIEELYSLMYYSGITFPGPYVLKKGLFGSKIIFNTYMQVQPRLKVKNNLVIVRKAQRRTTVAVGGMPSLDVRATRQRIEATREGGIGKAFTGGIEYFLNVIEAVRYLLQPRM